MSAPDPIPAEIRDRIKRAREAVAATVAKGVSGDHAAYEREVAAAKHELANAYQAAYEAVPFPAQTLHYVLLDAYNALRSQAYDYEREAAEFEHGRRSSWRQA